MSIVPIERKPIDTETCCICFEEFSTENKGVELICHHSFHRECVGEWIRTKVIESTTPNCPYCRADIAQTEDLKEYWEVPLRDRIIRCVKKIAAHVLPLMLVMAAGIVANCFYFALAFGSALGVAVLCSPALFLPVFAISLSFLFIGGNRIVTPRIVRAAYRLHQALNDA